MAEQQSVQDKHHLPEAAAILLRNRYQEFLQASWWLDPYPVYAAGNMVKRHEFAKRMSGRDGNGEPVWSGAVEHFTESLSGAPFSVSGPQKSVDAVIDVLHSAPGGYRVMMRQIADAIVCADLGACVEFIYSAPRRIRENVNTKPVPVRLDVFDPSRIRLIATEAADYPFAYKSRRTLPSRPAGVDGVLMANEVPLHQLSVRRIVNRPQTDEEFLGCGVSPTALYASEWTLAMAHGGLQLADATNMAAYTLLVARGLTEEQMDHAMEAREMNLAEGKKNALASALMVFASNDFMDESNAPSITPVPFRRYPEGWNWREALERQIQLACTHLGISPLAVMQSLYSRTTQAGTQASSDESGVRRAAVLVGIGDHWDWLAAQHGAAFSYGSHRIADRAREIDAQLKAVQSWKFAYEATNNGIPLMADTAEEAASRIRTMMVEQRLIRADYAEGETMVTWDTGEGAGTGSGAPSSGRASAASSNAKMMAYIAAAARHDAYVCVDVDPSESGTRVRTTKIGTCKLRSDGANMWRGWSAKQIQWASELMALREALLPGVRLKEGGGRAPAGAPRAMRAHQDAWETELQRLLDELQRNLQAPWKEANREKLLGLIDHWQTNAEAASSVAPEKWATAQRLIEDAYQAVNDNDQKKMIVLLALLLFADGVQRRGEAAMQDALAALKIEQSPAVAQAMAQILSRHGSYVTGSLTPDVVDFWQRNEKLSGSLDRRVKVLYAGALWSAMQQLSLAGARVGLKVRIDGPEDENNCMVSDPGGGIACEEIVGQTYQVGIDNIPILGLDTKCLQACRHWYNFLPA